MLAGFVILSAAIGFVAMGATIALSMPVWITLAVYPAIGSLTLLICAAASIMRSPAETPHASLNQRHSHG